MKRKTKNNLMILAVSLFVLLIFSLKNNFVTKNSTYYNVSGYIQPEISSLSLNGFTPISVSVDAIYLNYARITLHAGCYEIEANTDPYVARAIEAGLTHKVYFRPTVYDVIRDIFENYGIKVLMVKINEVKNNTFIGRLYVQKDNKILALDVRPSDATAIALRMGAPIYMNTTLIKEYGHYIC